MTLSQNPLGSGAVSGPQRAEGAGILHGGCSRVCFPGTSEASGPSSANPMPLKQEGESNVDSES